MTRIQLVVTDLDNTLYDWVTYFATAFEKMTAVAAEILGVDIECLLNDLQEVHQKYHNSEQPFALLEARCVIDQLPGLDRRERWLKLKPAFDTFKKTRTKTLKLYPSVQESLKQLQSVGTLIVGHTEAAAINARYRLTILGVAEYFDCLYAIADVGEGHPSRPTTRLRKIPTRALDPTRCKPNPEVLLSICAEMGVPPHSTLYVGDSLVRDIGMAKAAGAIGAWAKYGTRYDRTHWDTLVRITHWTADDVRRAKLLDSEYATASPDVILENRFDELLSSFEFASPPVTHSRIRTARG